MASTSQKQQDQDLVYGTDPENVVERLELDELVTKKPDTLNMYLLALAEMMEEKSFHAKKKNSKDQVDYFTFLQLAGVHGLPAEPWTGVDGKLGVKVLKEVGGDNLKVNEDVRSRDPDKNSGYCAHGSILFPTWHRVYLLAYEQAIYNKAVEIAERYPEGGYREKYLNAAKEFRLPYWDPVMPRNKVDNPDKKWFNQFGVPKILTAPEVYVRTPKDPSTPSLVSNPLFGFHFRNIPDDDGESDPLDRPNWPPFTDDNGHVRPLMTWRWPKAEGGPFPAVSDSVTFERSVQEQAAVSARAFHRLFAIDRDWFDFSNHAKADREILWSLPNRDHARQLDANLSLESWHDCLHNLCGGGGGHMTDPAIAAYDPIFWMHHCNIDRMISIYQTRQPDTYVTGAVTRTGTLAFGMGTEVSEQTPLLPFRKSPGDSGASFWNSTQVRDWTKLGYTYESTSQSAGPAERQKIDKYIADRYDWIGKYTLPPSSFDYPKDLSKIEAIPDASKVPLDTKVPELPANPPSDVYPEHAVVDGKIKVWDIGVRVPKFEFQRTVNIHVFLGAIEPENDTPARWGFASMNCGFTTVFVNSSRETCKNCQVQTTEQLTYESVVPITMVLRRFLENFKLDGYPGDNPLPKIARSLPKIKSLEPTDELKNWLRDNLIFRVQDVSSDTEIPFWDRRKEKPADASSTPRTVMDLKFQVQMHEYTLPTKEFPLGVYSTEAHRYPEITGLKEGEF